MRKILLMILVFVICLSLSGIATAAALKPPASICLNTNGGVVFSLVVKPGSSIKMLDGTQKFYSIQGALISSLYCAAVGAGYMEGSVFHFTLTGTWNNGGTANWIQGEGYWDVISHTGTMYAYSSITGDWTLTLSQVACSDYEILSQGLGAEGSPLLGPK